MPKDQFAVLYFSTSLIILIQVYNWDIRHHSLVCCCGFADILNILNSKMTEGLAAVFWDVTQRSQFFGGSVA